MHPFIYPCKNIIDGLNIGDFIQKSSIAKIYSSPMLLLIQYLTLDHLKLHDFKLLKIGQNLHENMEGFAEPVTYYCWSLPMQNILDLFNFHIAAR